MVEPEAWACPHCLASLRATADGPSCTQCGAQFALDAGRPDFRPSGRIELCLHYRYDAKFGRFPDDRLALGWPARPAGVAVKRALGAQDDNLLCLVPAPRGAARSLDVGCGASRQRFARSLDSLGYTHLGIDIEGPAPDALADAHLLPFADACFDVVVTSAVWEHLKNPHVAMAEVARVLRTGGTVAGTVAAGEPFHSSYFHHSPWAVFELLDSCGLDCELLVVDPTWDAFRANLQMGYAGARYPRFLGGLLAGAISCGALVRPAIKALLQWSGEHLRQHRLMFARSHSALVGFRARRREGPAPTRLMRALPSDRLAGR